MAIPDPPIPAGTKIRLPIVIEVSRDLGDTVEVLYPDLNGGSNVLLAPRTSLEPGEVIPGG